MINGKSIVDIYKDGSSGCPMAYKDPEYESGYFCRLYSPKPKTCSLRKCPVVYWAAIIGSK